MSEIKLIINGKECVGQKGQTILEIANANGIFIPTLCHLAELKHYGACGVCVVEGEGLPKLMRACSTVAADGWKINTESKRVVQARKIALELLMSDHDGDCKGPCHLGCPAHTDVQGYVKQIALGNDTEAVKIIKEKIPLPASIGRVCPHPCEEDCRRQFVESPLSIAYLKAFAADNDMKSADPFKPELAASTGKKVAIVGGGPSGLSAAYYLALMGHKVTVYDMHKKLGGMMRYGIPSYRYPREKLDGEIASILSLGIEAHTETKIGVDISFEELKNKFDAVYVAIGAHTDKKVGIEGEDAQGVISAVEMLRGIGNDEMPDFTGLKVAVIGGGNVAMDCTRSAIRLGAEKVTCVYRRRQEDMTAQAEEVEGAIAEGAEVLTLHAPVKIEVDAQGNAAALWAQPQIIGEMDKAGRPRPNNAKLEEVRIPADIIVVAIGQGIEIAGFDQAGVPVKRGGTVVAELSGQVGNMENVFAGGDCVTGPATAIRAIAGGKVAAYAIDEYLGYHHTLQCDLGEPTLLHNNRVPTGRVNIQERSSHERKQDFEHVEYPITVEEAVQECRRCLRCDKFGCGVLEGAAE